MKHWKYPFFVLLAGSCGGVFFYIRSFPVVIRFYTDTGGNSIFPWASSSLLRLGVYILVANLILFAIWVIYSFGYSRLSGRDLKNILHADAYTYLPLCVLAISVFQFNTWLTKGFVLLSQNAGYLLLLMVLIAVYYLKVQNHRNLRGTPEKKAPPPSPPQGGNYILTWKIRLLIFLISFVIYMVVGARVTDELGPGGDEPHYLLITHSLLYDHDLAINNNYKQRDYQAFFSADLKPHVSIGKDGTRYPGHPIGLPIFLIPVYALKGYQGAVVFMNFLAALLALQLYVFAFSITRSTRLSLLLWFVVSFTSPLLLYACQIYPEIPSALLLVIAYRLISSPQSSLEGGRGVLFPSREGPGVGSFPLEEGRGIFPQRKKLSHSFILGGTLALLPWIQQRMILPAVILTLYFIATSKIITWRKQWNKQQILYTIIPLLLFALSGIAMAGFYYTLYRNPMPNAPYTSIGMPNVFSLDIFLKQGLLGLLFDQEGGLFIYSPYYLFMFAGFLLCIRYHFWRVFWLFFLILSIYIPCGGFILQWRGAWSPVSRYMVALVPFFFPLLCEAIRYARRDIYRYMFFFFVVISFYWSYLFFHTPFLAIMRGRGINNLLEQISDNVVDPSRYFPSFTDTSSPGTYLLTGMWILVTLAFSFSIYRSVQKGVTPPCPPQREKSPPLTPPGRGITPPYPPQGGIVPGLKNVGKCYGLLLGLLLIFTFISEHVESNIIPLVANNKHLRNFLYNFDHYAQMSPQQPLAYGDLQFEYLSRKKWGKVDKQGPRFITSGPYDPFPAGKYTAYFKIMIADNSSEDIIATADIVADRGNRLFSKRDLRGVDFSVTGQYELMPLQFELREDVHDLEARVYFHNRVEIIVKKIYIKPDFSDFYYRAGMSTFWEGRYEKAKSIFSQALSISNHLGTRYQIGVIEQILENWGSSVAILQHVIEDEADFADAHYRLGLALQENNNLEKAHTHFEQAISLLPSHLDAWSALQMLYQQSGMNVEAENAENTIKTLYQPQNPYAVNFGNQVMFMGYSVRNPDPGKLEIDYYWKALSPIKRDYVFFVHFKQYSTKFQQDHAPQIRDPLTGQNTYYSTSQWHVGELVHERFEIAAPAGTFDIHLGVWDPYHTKERLPVMSSSQKSFFKKKQIVLKNIVVK